MSLSFLPKNIQNALSNLNYNFLSEIRLRRGQPVMVEYKGKYCHLNSFGIAENQSNTLKIQEIDEVILAATGGCLYNYTEQMKNGFITVGHGIRIGIAGEYVTQNGAVNAIKNITSLNIRIPHDVVGCSDYICKTLFCDRAKSTLIFSKAGLGKTTMLRDITKNLSKTQKYNILVFDERNEISAMSDSDGYDLGERVDVVRCYEKKSAIASAIRAMKPNIIITDELYGEDDLCAMRYAADCGITVIASSHVCRREILKEMPFEYFVQLVKMGSALLYDKNFNIIGSSSADNDIGNVSA